MKAMMFPGQGAQKKGMGKALLDDFLTLVRKADDVLGYSIRELCVDDPRDELKNTRYTQPALYTVSALDYLKRYEDTSVEPDYVLGHSLGEYAALFSADCFDFDTGVRIVAKRGELMARASGGGMSAVIGSGLAELPELVGKHAPDVDVANFNSDEQVVLSGPVDSLAKLREPLSARGWRVVPLNVSASFHSRYMQEARREFADFLTTIEIRPPRIPVISNVTATPYGSDTAEIRRLLEEQLTAPVRWTDSVRYLRKMSVSDWTEAGPGQVLTGLIGKIA